MIKHDQTMQTVIRSITDRSVAMATSKVLTLWLFELKITSLSE